MHTANTNGAAGLAEQTMLSQRYFQPIAPPRMTRDTGAIPRTVWTQKHTVDPHVVDPI